MELHSLRSSAVMENGTELNTTDVEWNADSVDWEEEISLEEAKELLERAMYPFKKVTHTHTHTHTHIHTHTHTHTYKLTPTRIHICTHTLHIIMLQINLS